MNYAWNSAESALQRENQLAINKVAAEGSKNAGLASAAGTVLGSLVRNAFGGADTNPVVKVITGN
jgi:hypothetical protein